MAETERNNLQAMLAATTARAEVAEAQWKLANGRETAALVELSRISADAARKIAALRERAEAAEAALAAVPVDALRRYFKFPLGEAKYSIAEQEADAAAIDAWRVKSEAQP